MWNLYDLFNEDLNRGTNNLKKSRTYSRKNLRKKYKNHRNHENPRKNRSD